MNPDLREHRVVQRHDRLGAGLRGLGTLLKKEQDIDTAQRRFTATPARGRS